MLPVFMLVIPGIVARVLWPEEIEADSNVAYPLLVLRLMPEGVFICLLVRTNLNVRNVIDVERILSTVQCFFDESKLMLNVTEF